MKKPILFLCFLFSGITVFAQQFSQYSTGTLYDSFENPSQRSFIPDSSRSVAFNFFLPTFNFNTYLTGNAQAALKNRAFVGSYNDNSLTIGQNKYNRLNFNVNMYSIMVKVFTSLKGDQEIGFSLQTKVEGNAIFSDETIQLVSNYTKFTNSTYNDIFNDHFYLQTYHQLAFTYREKINKQFAIGFKLSALSGISYNEIDVKNSSVTYDQPNDQATLSMAGLYYSSYKLNGFNKRNLLPVFQNPGAAIGISTSYRTSNGVTLQWNLKDLGFIHWYSKSQIGAFDGTRTIHNLSQPHREDSIKNALDHITTANLISHSFSTPINGHAEISASKMFPLNYDASLRYTPTFILSKELYYTGLTGALVNHIQYKNVTTTLTGAYTDLRLFNFGAQFMVKGPNSEFFIGSERLFQSANLARAINKTPSALGDNTQFTGADFFIGCSFKFGYIIEHQANSSYIPLPNDSDKGFFGRLFDRVFSKNKQL